jgi:hypothetical protein
MVNALKVAIIDSGYKQRAIAQRAELTPARLTKIVHQWVKPTEAEKTRIAEARLLLDEMRERHCSFMLTLDYVLEKLQARENRLISIIEEIRQELTRIRADFRTDASLLHLIEPRKTGAADGTDKSNNGGERTETDAGDETRRSRLLAGYVSHEGRRGLRKNRARQPY